MAKAAWSESCSVGHPLLDSDHRILVGLLDQLLDAMETGQSRDVIGNVVEVLAEYVQHYFLREEAILAAGGFPDLEAHRQEHRDLEAKVGQIRDRYNGGDRNALGNEVVVLLKKWLTDHILVSDNSYRPWVERINGGGTTPASAAERGFGTS
jgi:hemerythrin